MIDLCFKKYRSQKPKILNKLKNGFTLVELVMIILLLSIVSVAVAVKWPTNMDERAATLEFTRAVRFAQHMALTRQWTGAGSSWGIAIAGNNYFVGRADADCTTNCNNTDCAEDMMCNRPLLGNPAITLAPTSSVSAVLFNGLGEPIDNTGTLLASSSFLIDGASTVTVCAETGYVLEGNSCL